MKSYATSAARYFGHRSLVLLALAAVSAGAAMAMLVAAERAGAEGQGDLPCPPGTIAEGAGFAPDGSGSATVGGLTFQFTSTGQGTASFTVSGGTFSGVIDVKGGPVHNRNGPFDNVTSGSVTAATNPNNNQPFGISHIDICVTESDGNGEPPNGEPPNGEPPNGEEPTDGGEEPEVGGDTDGDGVPDDQEVASAQPTDEPTGDGETLAQEDADQAAAPAEGDPVGRETLAQTGLPLVPLALLGASMLFAGLGLGGAVRRRH